MRDICLLYIYTCMYVCCSNGQSCHTFHLLAEKDARIAFPTVQQLLEHSCAQQQLKFKQAPPYLLLHMPRFGKDFRMYDKILPTLELDITDVLQGGELTTVMSRLSFRQNLHHFYTIYCKKEKP